MSGRKKNKRSKRKQSRHVSDILETLSDPGPSRSPEVSDVEEGSCSFQEDDNQRVPPIALVCSSDCPNQSYQGDPLFTDAPLSLMRYVSTRPGRNQPRVVSNFPLNQTEPLVSYNRQMARVSPRSVVMSPQEQMRRERAALLCPCRRVPPSAREVSLLRGGRRTVALISPNFSRPPIQPKAGQSSRQPTVDESPRQPDADESPGQPDADESHRQPNADESPNKVNPDDSDNKQQNDADKDKKQDDKE